MRAKFIRDPENPLDSLDIGRTKERKKEELDKKYSEIWDAIEKITPYEMQGLEKPDYVQVGFSKNTIFYYMSYSNSEGLKASYYSHDKNMMDRVSEEVKVNSIEEGIEKIKTWMKFFQKRVHESINFNRNTDNPFDSLQIGEVVKRKLKSAKFEMEESLYPLLKEYGLEETIQYEEGEKYTTIFFKYKVYVGSIKFEYPEQFYVEWYNRLNHLIENLDYDDIDYCINKIKWWLDNY
jgi:hypothetical protein